MAKVVVPGNTELVALVAEVVLVAAHADPVHEASHRPVVRDGLPGVSRVDHASVDAALDEQLLLGVSCVIVPVPGLYDQCVRPRPRELERDQDLPPIVDLVGVVLGAPERKRISTENLRRSSSEGALSGGGDRLVLLQAHSQVSVALVSSAAAVRGAPGAVAALPVRQLAVYILHGDQLQLEIAGRLGHLGPQRQQQTHYWEAIPNPGAIPHASD